MTRKNRRRKQNPRGPVLNKLGLPIEKQHSSDPDIRALRLWVMQSIRDRQGISL